MPYSLAVSKLKSFSILIGSNTITILVLANLLCCLWIRINGYVTTNNKSDYINAQYFLFTTASTIGYGDILVQHQRTDTVSGRYAFATFMILVCLIFFAYVQSLINSIRTEWTLVDDRLQGLLEEFVDWMTNRSMASGGRIPFKFETTLIDFFDYLYTNDIYSTVSMNGFIDLLGEKLKLQLTKMTARGLVEKYVFLADIDDEIAAEIILNSEAVSFVEGDKVLTRGQQSEAVYLMLKGKVSVEYPPEDLKIDVLEEKEHFGDICVLSKKSHFDYVCKTSVVCLQVKKSTLDEVLLKSRHTLSKLVSNSRLRLRYMLFMKNKAVAAKQKYLQMKNLKAAMFNKEEFDLHWIENILKSEKFKDELEDGLPGFAGSNEAFRDAETEQNPHNNCGSNPLIDADARLATEGDELLRDFVHENLMLNGNGVSNQQADVSIQEIPQDKLRTPVKLQTFSMKPKPRDTTEEKKFAPSLQAKSAFDPTDAASVASTGIKGVSLKKNWSTAVRPPPTTETEEPEKDEPDFSKMPVSKLKHLKTVFTKTKLAQPSKPNMVEMLAQMAVSKDELETSFNSIDKEDSKHAADAIKNLLDKADAVTQHKLMEVQKTEKVVFGVTVGEALFDLDDEQDDSCEMDDPIASVSSESIRLKIEESIKMAEAKLQHVKCKFRVFFKNFQGDFEFIEDEIRVKTNKLIRIEVNHSNKSLPLSEPLSV